VRLRANLRATAVVALRSPEPKPVDSGQLQLHLPGAGRAFDRARHAEPTSPALIRARRIAQALGEGRGWNTKLAAELDRASWSSPRTPTGGRCTTGDINAVADALRGHLRRRTLGALRSLTRHCKKNGTIFADPAARVRIGHRDEPIILPLGANQIHDATQAATTPAARIALALAAVHAARPEAIRTLRLDDVDLGNRRLTIGSVTRPLDELTHRLLIDWLEYRRRRWPNTANPHLIINKQTASTIRAISDNALTAPFRRRAALRVDRQLDEALTHGPDPLHLAVVFGLDETTAIRYCAAARQILQTPAEKHDPPG
jgi:integrase